MSNRSDVYTALQAAGATDIRWISQPEKTDTFPVVIYSFFDQSGVYAMAGDGIENVSDEITVQVDIYVDSDDPVTLDDLYVDIQAAMEDINYRLINSPTEIRVDDINKIVRPMRFEKYV